jgi:hypothetical protein
MELLFRKKNAFAIAKAGRIRTQESDGGPDEQEILRR